MNKVLVIIPHYKNQELLKRCIDSLIVSCEDDYDIVVIDNGSTDHSCDFLDEINYRKYINIISLTSNTGFSYAVNQGIHYAQKSKYPYVFVLNDDTYVSPGTIRTLRTTLELYDDVVSVQPLVMQAHQKDSIDSAGIVITRDMSALNDLQGKSVTCAHREPYEIFGTTGCASLYRVDMITRASYQGNVFDNHYFAYYEDVELAFRLRLFGYRSFCVPTARIEHVHSATGTHYSSFKSFHIHRNHVYTLVTYANGLHRLSFLLRIPFRYGLLLSSIFKKKGPAHRLAQTISPLQLASIVFRAWKDVFKKSSYLMKKRAFIKKNRKVSLQEEKSWYTRFGVSLEKTIYEERS